MSDTPRTDKIMARREFVLAGQREIELEVLARDLERELKETRDTLLWLNEKQVKGAAALPEERATPEGWMLVPLEPSNPMRTAYRGAIKDLIEKNSTEAQRAKWAWDAKGYRIPEAEKIDARWKAMLSAVSPLAPPSEAASPPPWPFPRGQRP